jgi:hypothetical protein
MSTGGTLRHYLELVLGSRAANRDVQAELDDISEALDQADTTARVVARLDGRVETTEHVVARLSARVELLEARVGEK